MASRVSWLSVTPEPERELPQAVATLVLGRRPPPGAVLAERVRIERLVLRGRQRRWLGYLHRVVDLIERRAGDGDPEVVQARLRATAVIVNHHELLLGLSSGAARRTAGDRARLAAVHRSRPTTEDNNEHHDDRTRAVG